MVCGGATSSSSLPKASARVWSNARQPVWHRSPVRSRVRFRLPADHHLPIKTAVVVRKDQRAGPLQGLNFKASSMSSYPNSGDVKSGFRCHGGGGRRLRLSAPRSCCMLQARGACPSLLGSSPPLLLRSFAPGPVARDFIDVLMSRLLTWGSLSPLGKSCSSHILVPGVEGSPEGALAVRSSPLKMAITVKSIL